MHYLEDVLISHLIRHRVHRLDLASGTSMLRVSVQAPWVLSQVIVRLVREMGTMGDPSRKPSGRTSTLRGFPKRLVAISGVRWVALHSVVASNLDDRRAGLDLLDWHDVAFLS